MPAKKRYFKAPSQKMIDVLRRLRAGQTITWASDTAYYSSDLRSCTPSVLGLRDRGYAEVIFNSAWGRSGYVQITPNGRTFLEGLK